MGGKPTTRMGGPAIQWRFSNLLRMRASYTIIRPLQEFDVLENASVDQLAEPWLQANLVLAHHDGLNVSDILLPQSKGKRGA
ncbi:hypothetical protein N7462_001699 [Penicillium macrosclerotiorum]|uniref:uncharacterized protein n=1 Tax=Penicillium macrosclerotiorum TaxID=303699 RepID=UPI002546E042|nr:uncharacterized protein N7462_001699 [Penicillium macrosclerotiorum]KAJ5692276.1 hypothetical protein N7462_001699 [Penicillium macrosclerotiorum]